MNGLTENPRIAFITGGTHGIGKSTAEMFANNGWEVYICASNSFDNRGALMEKELPNLKFRLADVTDEDAIRSIISEIIETHGKLDLAFNNAGIGCKPRLPHDADLGIFERVIKTNLIGTAISMKHEIRAMLQQKEIGIIINCASISAYKARTGADYSYSASKAAIVALTREAAAINEYRNKVLFYTIIPGYIETRMTATENKSLCAEKLPGGTYGKPEDVANVIMKISETTVFPTGQSFYVDGGDFLI